MSLVEMLLALAIMASLLAAVAVAMHASLMSYDENDKAAMVTQAARISVERIMRRVRGAYEVDSNENSLTIYMNPELSDYYQYEQSAGCLYCHQNTGEGVDTYILLGDENITVDTFDVLRQEDLEGNTLSVKIRLEVSTDTSEMGITATSALRRAQSY